MISEWRLNTLVGRISSVEYQLDSKRELAGELVSTADEYGRRALEPAASVTSAAETSDTAAMLSRLNQGEQQRLTDEIDSLEQEKARLLSQLYEEGMQTGRWIGVGDRYVHLSSEDSGANQDSGSELRLHDIPKGYDGYMLIDEDPEVTARRVQYAGAHHRGIRQLTLIVGMSIALAFLTRWEVIPLWGTLIGLAAVIGLCPWVFPEAARIGWRIISPSQVPDSPWLEIMPDSGERFDMSTMSTGSSLEVASGGDGCSSESSSEAHERAATATGHRKLNANDRKRGHAYAQIEAAQHIKERKVRRKR